MFDDKDKIIIDKICEAALWDNLKRNANVILRRIESLDTKARIKVFTEPRFAEIQNLLDGIGKDFFRLFFLQAIKDGYEDKKECNKLTILETAKEFQYFFLPGYTTLSGNRIFIEGANKPGSDVLKYFSGVGNRPLQCDSNDLIEDYFRTKNNNPNNLTKNSENFWIYNIPSTLAFDSIMNQFYLDLEHKENMRKLFITGSTHFWKSIQKSKVGENKFKFMPMPLKSDQSEIRILEIQTLENFKYGVKAKDNKLSIFIDNTKLLNSGEFIAKKLNANYIPINFQKHKDQNGKIYSDKEFYCNWPFYHPRHKEGTLFRSDDRLNELQILAYNFWLSETIYSQSKNATSYDFIKKRFSEEGYQYLSDKLNPFCIEINKIKQEKLFCEVYYKNWYTIFLESYSEQVDLGTAMFLTNHKFNSDFLMKCSHWIRWIYNELRLLEAKTWEEKTAFEVGEEKGRRIQVERDFGKIAHNTKLFFPFLIDKIKSINNKNYRITKKTVIDELVDLENIFKASYYLNNIIEFKKHFQPEKVCLKKLIDKIVEQIEYDILNNEGKIIKLPRNLIMLNTLIDAIHSVKNPLFKISMPDNFDPQVYGHSAIIQIILKDIISNATKWCTSQENPGIPKPIVYIKISQSKTTINFECTNSELINSEAIEIFKTGHIGEKSTLSKCFGLMISKKYCTEFNISHDVIISKMKKKTKFVLKFEKWTNLKY